MFRERLLGCLENSNRDHVTGSFEYIETEFDRLSIRMRMIGYVYLSLIQHVRLFVPLLMMLCLFARVAHFTNIQIYEPNYVKKRAFTIRSPLFILFRFLRVFAFCYGVSRLLAHSTFALIPFESGGDGDFLNPIEFNDVLEGDLPVFDCLSH